MTIMAIVAAILYVLGIHCRMHLLYRCGEPADLITFLVCLLWPINVIRDILNTK